MMKRLLVLFLPLLLQMTACGMKNPYEKYQAEFSNVFDTFVIIVGYCKSQAEFEQYSQIMYNKLVELNRQFDIYHDYDGINNLKTVNDNAGAAPVEVSDEIIALMKRGKFAYAETNGAVNIAMGSVLRIWHAYRTEGLRDPLNASLPPMEQLREAAKNTDIDNLIINEQARTVFLKSKGMSLDVGSIAKGFAASLAVDAARAAGMESCVANVGGNVISVGKPFDGVRDRWGVGIQDPRKDVDGTANVMDTIFTNDMAVVSSGDYQRYYIVDGQAYNHIIDPVTLMPANRYAAVTVVYPDSATADVLSTALYILPQEAGERLLTASGAQALWIMKDGEMKATYGYEAMSKFFSGYSAVDEK